MNTGQRAANVHVIATLTCYAAIIAYTEVLCAACGRRLLSVPHQNEIRIRLIPSNNDRSGFGFVASCPRCKALNEILP